MEGTGGGKAVQRFFLQLGTRVGQDLVHPGATLCTSPDTSAHQEPPNLPPSLSPAPCLTEFLPLQNMTSKQSFDLMDRIHHMLCSAVLLQMCEFTRRPVITAGPQP